MVDKISVGYGKIPVLRDFSLDVPAGGVMALVGPNGAGKTTLVKAISGLLRSRQGTISLDGENLLGRGAHRIARAGVIQVPENRDIFGGLTIWENLKVAFDNLDPEGKEDEAFGRHLRQHHAFAAGEQALGDGARHALLDGGWPLAEWAVLLVWGVLAAALATRFFRWAD